MPHYYRITGDKVGPTMLHTFVATAVSAAWLFALLIKCKMFTLIISAWIFRPQMVGNIATEGAINFAFAAWQDVRCKSRVAAATNCELSWGPRTASSSVVKVVLVVAACKHIKLNYCHWSAARSLLPCILASLRLRCPCRCRYCPRLSSACRLACRAFAIEISGKWEMRVVLC